MQDVNTSITSIRILTQGIIGNGAARIRKRTDMERYTEKIDGLWTVLCEYSDLPCPVVTQDVIDLLAAYEDTGLSPEEIIELKARMEGLEK